MSDDGRRQTAEAAEYLVDREIRVIYSSPLIRCRDTADVIATRLRLPVNIDKELVEVAAGDWEGLPFDEIRTRWPEWYAQRGEHIGTVAPPGGESFLQAGKRLDAAVRRILSQTEGSLVVVTHGGIMRGWLCLLLGVDPDRALDVRQPWGGISEVVYDGAFRVVSHGLRPGLPTSADIERLYHKYQTPEPVIEHCRAVAGRAAELASGEADVELLKAAALLHDLCRTEGKGHPEKVAKVLDAEGWPRLADIVARHHALGENPSTEAELLALADRLTLGTRYVSIDERFSASRAKCETPDALAAWQKRYDETKHLYEKYDKQRH